MPMWASEMTSWCAEADDIFTRAFQSAICWLLSIDRRELLTACENICACDLGASQQLKMLTLSIIPQRMIWRSLLNAMDQGTVLIGSGNGSAPVRCQVIT